MTSFEKVLLLLVFPMLLVQVCRAQSIAIYEYTMESGDLRTEGLDHGIATSHGNPPQITSERARSGKYSLRSYIHRLNSDVSYRSEVSLNKDHAFRHAIFGEHYWYGFSIFIPDDFQPVDIWEVLAQWHAWPDQDIGESWRSPPLNLNSGPDGVWQVVSRWDAKTNTFSNGEKNYGGVKRWRLGSVEDDKGEWVDWVFHMAWSWHEDGLLEVWKDGVKVVQHKGPNTFNDALGPYFKMGIYLGWKDRDCCMDGPMQREIFHDDLRIAVGTAAGFQHVSPSEHSGNEGTH